jgi:hypothetical protein
VISSPVAGFRPWRFFCAGLTRTVSLDKTDDTDFLRVAELFDHDLLQRPEDSLGLSPWDLGAISDSDRELCLGERQTELLHG